MNICACDVNCEAALSKIQIFEVFHRIYMGPFQSGFKTKELIDLGITHVMNATCKAYTQRTKYFKYLNLPIYDLSNEDAKRHFRITNRFIKEALNSHGGQGKILVHSVEGTSRAAVFILAYLIGVEGIKLKEGLSMLRQFVREVEPNEGFMQ